MRGGMGEGAEVVGEVRGGGHVGGSKASGWYEVEETVRSAWRQFVSEKWSRRGSSTGEGTGVSKVRRKHLLALC